MRDLEAAWRQGQLVVLAAAELRAQATGLLGSGVREVLEARWGPGVVLVSGGSMGGRRWCLLPQGHLEASAQATATWLRAQGLDPAACCHWNPLPQHHVSGLLPAVRARQWGGEHRPIPAALMRDPGPALLALAAGVGRPGLLSLVPTQLERLLAVPEAVAWLRQMALIWVGGAALPAHLAAASRQAGLPLAPCYGATETAAMVCAMPPARFLAGDSGCGLPLGEAQVRLDPATGAVEVRSTRLSPGWLAEAWLAGGASAAADPLHPLPLTADGWWRSGDLGRLVPHGLEVWGRLDGAISSGGETVFPDQLEARIKALALAGNWPLKELLLLGLPEPGWGERLVALVRVEAGAGAYAHGAGAALMAAMEKAAASWPPAERPRRWLLCPQLAPTALGKWEREHWRAWAAQHLKGLEGAQA